MEGSAGGALAALKARRLATQPGQQRQQQEQEQQQQQHEQHDYAAQAQPRLQRSWQWQCSECNRECVPIRSESRCLCGHRLKEHAKLGQEGPMSDASACSAARCGCKRFFLVVAEGSWVLHCRCKHKHIDHDPVAGPHPCRKASCKGSAGGALAALKASRVAAQSGQQQQQEQAQQQQQEQEEQQQQHEQKGRAAQAQPKLQRSWQWQCDSFFSPWVCNCDHAWASHTQRVVEREVKTIQQLMTETGGELDPFDVKRGGLDGLNMRFAT